MKKLKIGYKDRTAKPVEFEGIKFFVKPMSQEVMVGLGMYSNGMRDRMMTDGEKRSFVKTHITDWQDMFFDDGSECIYTEELSLEYLTDEDYDDLFMMLYWESVKLANAREEEVSKGREKAKK